MESFPFLPSNRRASVATAAALLLLSVPREARSEVPSDRSPMEETDVAEREAERGAAERGAAKRGAEREADHGAAERGAGRRDTAPDAAEHDADGRAVERDANETSDAPNGDPDGATDDGSSSVPPGGVVPPKLVDVGDLTLSEEARAEARRTPIELELVVGADGAVRDAVIRSGPPGGAAEVVRDAALGFRFEPARRDGRAVAARVLYRYEPPAAPAGPSSSAAPAGVAPTGPAPVSSPAEPPPTSAPPLVDGAPLPDADAAPAPPEEVIVRGRRPADALRRSANAVVVLEVEDARRHAADLGEVLQRTSSVNVRRQGGLGSAARVSMAGLGGDQLRFFLDGIPLEYAGFPFGVANVPVNVVQRVEVYQGVVPARFGADALGGAVHLVTDEGVRRDRASASYQLGSFETHRVTASAQKYDAASGAFGRVLGFFDTAENDYPVDVEQVDASGRLVPTTARRFHDGYTAGGGQLSVGLVDQSFADRIVATAFVTAFERDIQHDPAMQVPYGEVTFGKRSAGGHLRYAHALSTHLEIDATAGYGHVATSFVDVGSCRYDWRGGCLVDLAPIRGEINQIPVDRRVSDHTGYARAELRWFASPDDEIRLALAPTVFRRWGDDREISGERYDALNATQELDSAVLGLEWERRFLDGRIANIAFGKAYGQLMRSEQLLATGILDRPERVTFEGGGGNALRVLLTDETYLKASYEYATRLPNPEEVFGNGGLVVRNLGLLPERSHNLNLGAFADAHPTRIGELRGSVNLFGRLSDDLIRLVNGGNYLVYENVLTARTWGVLGSFGWEAPRRVAGLAGNVSWQDVRNLSRSGPAAPFEGDRIPNLPYLQGSAEGRLRAFDVLAARDSLELLWTTSFVRRFFLAWESAGDPNLKLTVPDQLTHGLALTYLRQHGPEPRSSTLATTLEVQNLTNAKVFDFYGVQRPGRSVFVKIALDVN